MQIDSPSITHVSDTALWVAQYRANETERPDALFNDHLAKLLVGKRGQKIAQHMGSISKHTEWSLAIRTVVIDRFITKLISQGVDLVVNLGAGLDTRPYRMNLPASLRWIEVDFPQMIDYKEEKLKNEKPICQLERIRLDLSDKVERQALLTGIAKRSRNILVITEGVIPYLDEGHVAELAKDLHAHLSFKYWIGEYLAPQTYKYLQNPRRMKRMKNEPFRFYPADWFGFFKHNGWQAADIQYLPEVSKTLGRPIPAPWWGRLIAPFISKKRMEGFLRLSGYVVFGRVN